MSEKQYIEREAAISAFANYLVATFGADSHRTARTVECILKPIPAAPVREVVTCGECVYWQQCYRERGFCDEIWNEWTNRDDFCSHGKWANMREPRNEQEGETT